MKKTYLILSILFLVLAAVAVSCSNSVEELEHGGKGYLRLGIESNSTTVSRAVTNAPAGYDPKALYVEVTLKGASTPAIKGLYSNLKDTTHELEAGTYTITAHSANWDGSGSGVNAPYYYGETEKEVKAKTIVTANVVCTQANVKVTVEFSDDFKQNFSKAQTTISSSVEGVAAIVYDVAENKGPSYFPAADITAMLSVNYDNEEKSHSLEKKITDVQPRDHYRLVYKMAESGTVDNVNVVVDETGKEYTYTFSVPRKASTSLVAYKANAWSNMAYLEGAVTTKKSDFDATKVTLQWKLATAEAWTTVENSALTKSGDSFKYQLKGLTPSTKYAYRLVYSNGDDNVESDPSEFTTDTQPALYNGGFEEWYSVGNYSSPNANADTKYWDTSNPGSASFGYVVTDPSTDFVHGGTKSAYLHADYAVIKLAAGSIYTGQFGKVSGTSASLTWGVGFKGRPTALHGFKCYIPGTINQGTQPSGVGAPASGSNDIGIIRIALLTEQLAVNNKDMSTFPDWQTDKRIIAYGVLEFNQSDNNQWVEFTIPLEYHDLTKKPNYILVMGATCKYGDYFYGSDKSKLWLDDFELVYGDTPTVKQ